MYARDRFYYDASGAFISEEQGKTTESERRAGCEAENKLDQITDAFDMHHTIPTEILKELGRGETSRRMRPKSEVRPARRAGGGSHTSCTVISTAPRPHPASTTNSGTTL